MGEAFSPISSDCGQCTSVQDTHPTEHFDLQRDGTTAHGGMGLCHMLLSSTILACDFGIN